MAFLVEFLDPCADGAFEVARGLVGEVVALEVAPGPLDAVQFRGVYRLAATRRVIQGRAACAAVDGLLVWTGPLSSTSTTGRRVPPGLGPYRQSTSFSRPMKSALTLVGEVRTSNSRVAASSAPTIAILRAWPGA